MDYRDPVLHGEGGMRFIWFNLMPWPHLPEDFREKYRSVWVDIPSSLYDPVRRWKNSAAHPTPRHRGPTTSGA
jgi:hypothetical protein